MQREDLIRRSGTAEGTRGAAALRAADADRDATADQLRRAHVEGRLETAELEDRLEQCYAAKTYGELDATIADLPRQREHEHERTRSYRPRGLRLVPIVAVIVALAITSHAIWLLWWLAIFAFVRARRRGYRRYPRPI